MTRILRAALTEAPILLTEHEHLVAGDDHHPHAADAHLQQARHLIARWRTGWIRSRAPSRAVLLAAAIGFALCPLSNTFVSLPEPWPGVSAEVLENNCAFSMQRVKEFFLAFRLDAFAFLLVFTFSTPSCRAAFCCC